METKSTKNYDQFTFLPENRPIDQYHLKQIIASIKANNLLEMQPIDVNEDMEVVDGQHRLTAAKILGVPIFYRISKQANIENLLVMNKKKHWTMTDYFHYHLKTHKPEYLKLKDFMSKTGLPFNIAMRLTSGRGQKANTDFKDGLFVFKDISTDKEVDYCFQTIELLKRLNGNKTYYTSGKFWNPLLRLVKHPSYDHAHWMRNLEKLVSMVHQCVSEQEYMRLVQRVYNYNKRANIIDLIDDTQDFD